MKPVFNQEKKFMQFTDGNFVLTVYKGRWKVFMIRQNHKNINKKEYYERNLVIKAKNPALAGLGFSQILSAFIRLGGMLSPNIIKKILKCK